MPDQQVSSVYTRVALIVRDGEEARLRVHCTLHIVYNVARYTSFSPEWYREIYRHISQLRECAADKVSTLIYVNMCPHVPRFPEIR